MKRKGENRINRVLFADDDPDVREMYIDRFDLEPDLEVVAVAEDGLEALAIFRELRSALDLVILDHHMPGMDGLEVARIIQREDPQMPILMVSGDPSLRDRALDVGIKFLRRSVGLNKIIEQIRSLQRGDQMDKESLLKNIAPCGLLCFTCAAAKNGIIQQHGRQLLKYLESFDIYAEKMSAFDKRLKQYPQFKEVLQLIGEASCEGCRDGAAKFPGCGIAACIKEQGVDFCFQCELYPCDKADFEPLLKQKWLEANERMKQIGVEAYFDEAKERSHYA